MRKTIAANVALVLSPLAAILMLFATDTMGDPPRPQSEPELAARTFDIDVELCAALACFVACIWLSGFSFTDAPRRSVVSVIIAIAAVIASFNF